MDQRDLLEHNMKGSNSRKTSVVINLGEQDVQFSWRGLPLELPKPGASLSRLTTVPLGLAIVCQHDDDCVHSL